MIGWSVIKPIVKNTLTVLWLFYISVTGPNKIATKCQILLILIFWNIERDRDNSQETKTKPGPINGQKYAKLSLNACTHKKKTKKSRDAGERTIVNCEKKEMLKENPLLTPTTTYIQCLTHLLDHHPM